MESNITIVPFEERHLAETVEIYNHYIETSTVKFQEEPISADEFRKQVFFDDACFCAFAIVDADQDRLAGFCALGPWKSRCAYKWTGEISVYLREEYTGGGIGGRAVELLEGKANEHGFHAIMSEISGENTASIKLMKRSGYKRVGHLLEVGYKFGRYLDVVFYEKIL